MNVQERAIRVQLKTMYDRAARYRITEEEKAVSELS